MNDDSPAMYATHATLINHRHHNDISILTAKSKTLRAESTAVAKALAS